MKINYNINHRLLEFKIFRETEMTSIERMVTLITLSQIAHFHQHVGECVFNIKQMSHDLGPKRHYFSKALELLKSSKLIVETVPYDRHTQTPATYRLGPLMVKAMATRGIQYGHQRSKPGPSSGQVNNIK